MAHTSRRGVVAAALAALLTGGIVGQIVERPAPTPVERLVLDRSAVYEVPETQDIWYKAVPFARDTWGRPVTLPAVADEVRAAMATHRRAGFQVRPKSRDRWSAPEVLNAALLRFTAHVRGSQVGAVWYIRASADGYKYKASKVDLNPAVILDTPGTRAVDILIGTTIAQFPRVKPLGLCVVKRISGTNSWSQHSFANAIDWGGPGAWGSPDYVAYLDSVVRYLTRLDAKGYIPLAQLLWRGVANHYPGHVHLTGDPILSGPFCA